MGVWQQRKRRSRQRLCQGGSGQLSCGVWCWARPDRARLRYCNKERPISKPFIAGDLAGRCAVSGVCERPSKAQILYNPNRLRARRLFGLTDCTVFCKRAKQLLLTRCLAKFLRKCLKRSILFISRQLASCRHYRCCCFVSFMILFCNSLPHKATT